MTGLGRLDPHDTRPPPVLTPMSLNLLVQLR
jgi:hypothetical protein